MKNDKRKDVFYPFSTNDEELLLSNGELRRYVLLTGNYEEVSCEEYWIDRDWNLLVYKNLAYRRIEESMKPYKLDISLVTGKFMLMRVLNINGYEGFKLENGKVEYLGSGYSQVNDEIFECNGTLWQVYQDKLINLQIGCEGKIHITFERGVMSIEEYTEADAVNPDDYYLDEYKKDKEGIYRWYR